MTIALVKFRKPRTYLFALMILLFMGIIARAETPVERALPVELAAKYEHYLDGFKERHLYKGGTAEATLDEATKSKVVSYEGLGDSQGWTGLTMSAFAMQGDWNLVRKQLSYWELVEVEPGKYKRWPEVPDDYGHGDTSIDQYGEMLMGMAVVAVTGDDELKSEIARITREIITYGKAHDWIMGRGPWTDCTELKFLFQLLSERLELGVDVYSDGEDYDGAREKFLRQFKQAIFIRQVGANYFTMNLFFERLFVAKVLAPDLEGLDDMIMTWYKTVRKDGNALFDWFYAETFGKDPTKRVLKALDAFPSNLPNHWEPTGYHWGYRWQRSPKELKRELTISNREHTGMDYLVLAAYYSYYRLNDF